MGFFSVFRIKRMLAKVQKIETITAPLVVQLALETKKEIAAGVTSWDLDNKILLLFLGYVAGVIDAAEYLLYGKAGKPRKGILLIDCLFLKYINGFFSDLPRASVFVDFEEKSLFARVDGDSSAGEGAICGMQYSEFFKIAQVKGADDFFSVIEKMPPDAFSGIASGAFKGIATVKLMMGAILEAEGAGENCEIEEDNSCSESVAFETQKEADDYAYFAKSDPYVSEVYVKKKGDAWVVLVRSID